MALFNVSTLTVSLEKAKRERSRKHAMLMPFLIELFTNVINALRFTFGITVYWVLDRHKFIIKMPLNGELAIFFAKTKPRPIVFRKFITEKIGL
jgi:hypothetical protein